MNLSLSRYEGQNKLYICVLVLYSYEKKVISKPYLISATFKIIKMLNCFPKKCFMVSKTVNIFGKLFFSSFCVIIRKGTE